jgi:MSHA biogenesis protein MshJ
MSKNVLAPVERQLTQLSARYQKMSLRERVLIGVSILALTWMVWSASIGGFLEESTTRLHRDVNAVYAQMQLEVAEQTRLQVASSEDPNARLDRERSALSAELENLSENLGAALDRFVAPDKMPALLKDVIRHHDGLKMKRMVSLPVEAVVVSAQTDADAEGESEPAPVIYRHPLRLEFEGNYFEVLEYLNELENGEWKFGWRTLSYVVNEYPIAVVTLEIETLSQDRNWIGV